MCERMHALVRACWERESGRSPLPSNDHWSVEGQEGTGQKVLHGGFPIFMSTEALDEGVTLL